MTSHDNIREAIRQHRQLLHQIREPELQGILSALDRIAELECELAEAKLENERGEYEENQELRIKLTRSESRCKRLESALKEADRLGHHECSCLGRALRGEGKCDIHQSIDTALATDGDEKP